MLVALGLGEADELRAGLVRAVATALAPAALVRASEGGGTVPGMQSRRSVPSAHPALKGGDGASVLEARLYLRRFKRAMSER